MSAKNGTHKLSNSPLRQIVRIHAIDGRQLDRAERGSVHKVRGEANLFFVRYGKKRSPEFKGDATVSFVVSDADRCSEHDEPLFQIPSGMVYCKTCERETDKAYREAKRNGDPGAAERREQAKAERRERVVEEMRVRQVSREQALASLFRGVSHSGEFCRGYSAAKKAAYTRAMLTDAAKLHNITPERVADLAGIDPWEPMTWSEFRAAFPRREQEEEVA